MSGGFYFEQPCKCLKLRKKFKILVHDIVQLSCLRLLLDKADQFQLLLRVIFITFEKYKQIQTNYYLKLV